MVTSLQPTAEIMKKIPLIRPMQISDLPAIMTIEQAAHLFPWTKGILHDCITVGYSCWVIENEDKIVGFAIVMTAVNESHILNICIDPTSQRQGYGKLLMTHLIEVARSHQVDMMFLEVRKSNLAALKLYAELDFIEVGVRKNYYPTAAGHEDAIVLARSLI